MLSLVLSHLGGRRDDYLCHHCGFCLSFYKRKTDNGWVFRKDRSSLVMRNKCYKVQCPRICFRRSFLVYHTKNDLTAKGIEAKDAKFPTVVPALEKAHLPSSCFRTARRALDVLKDKTSQMIQLQDQQVEGFIDCLQLKGHYGVVLYNNNELVVPGSSGSLEHNKLDPSTIKSASFDIQHDSDCFWDRLESFPDNSEEKLVSMTFAANADAVYAFKHSIPVISLDACITRFCGQKTVLFIATLQTTDKNCLAMCYATAHSESIQSWSFFLLNLRQVITRSRV